MYILSPVTRRNKNFSGTKVACSFTFCFWPWHSFNVKSPQVIQASTIYFPNHIHFRTSRIFLVILEGCMVSQKAHSLEPWEGCDPQPQNHPVAPIHRDHINIWEPYCSNLHFYSPGHEVHSLCNHLKKRYVQAEDKATDKEMGAEFPFLP